MPHLKGQFLYSPGISQKKIFIIVLALLPFLIIENVDQYVPDFIVDFNISPFGIGLYVCIFMAYLIIQFFLIKFIDWNSKPIRSRSNLVKVLQTGIIIVQIALAINAGLVVATILLLSTYSTISLIFVTFVSNIVAAVILFIFATRFLTWATINRHSLGIIFFALGFLTLGFSEVVSGIGGSYLVSTKDNMITAQSKVQFDDFPEGSFFNLYYDNYYNYFDYASFILILLGTASLLYNYTRKINKLKLAVIIALPIIGYTSTLLDTFDIYDTDTNPDLLSYYIFQSLSKMFGIILFAISFIYVARKLPDSPIRLFLQIIALGFILQAISNHVDVNVAAYPPYGTNSFSLLPISTYIILFGIFASALSLSQDISLRNHLKSLARSDKNLLSSIGTAQMDKEVRRVVGELKSVIDKEEKEVAEESRIGTPLEEDEISDYLKQVVEEVQRSRK